MPWSSLWKLSLLDPWGCFLGALDKHRRLIQLPFALTSLHAKTPIFGEKPVTSECPMSGTHTVL